ncbi:MAG: NADAR family protein [Methanosarcinales archaeon]|nr:NADAR family protein [Methanosarcinales archaeon]
MPEDIYYYEGTKGRVEGKYRFLSNFYYAKMVIHGKEYTTVEHYFQSMKHSGTDLEEKIRLGPFSRALLASPACTIWILGTCTNLIRGEYSFRFTPARSAAAYAARSMNTITPGPAVSPISRNFKIAQL